MRVTRPPGEREQHYAQLRDAFATPGPVRLTPEGIALFVAASRARQRPEDLADDQRVQFDVLARAGLLGVDGQVRGHASEAANALSEPRVVLQIKAVRQHTAATWTAWLGTSRAFVAASASPALAPGDDPHAPVEPLTADGELDVEIVVPGWAPVGATRWLGVSPRPEQPAHQLRVDSTVLRQRVAGARVPPGPEADAGLRELWTQPMLLWAASTIPGESALLVLDAGAAGFWQVHTEGDISVLSACSSHQVWRDLMRLVVTSDMAGRQ